MASIPNQAETATELYEIRTHVWNTICSLVRSMSINCAVELGILDAIHRRGGRPVTLPELLAELDLPPSRALDLGRLMRMLEHESYFATEMTEVGAGEKGYVLTPSSEHVRERAASLVKMVMDPAELLPLIHLSSWFRSEAPTSFHSVHGMSVWEYASRNPEFNSRFNAGITYDSDLVVGALVAKCGPVFEGVRSVVDVGGNNGSVARAISDAFPSLKCIVYDLPHVVAGQTPTKMVEFVAGNMFDYVPQADVVLLKHILHDYNDEDCVKILNQCKKSIKPKEEGGKLVLVEMVLNVVIKKGDLRMKENQLFMDIVMLTAMGGREREEHEWRELFIQTGFSDHKITPISDILCLIEIFP